MSAALPLRRCLLLALCMLLPASPAPASFDADVDPASYGLPIETILVSGNERTREDYIRKWMGIEKGQILSFELIDNARQALRDTGLFKEINFKTEVHDNGELVLLLLLEEKKFTLLLPRVNRNGNGDIKAGLRLRMHNLQGADRTLEMLVQQEKETNGDVSDEVRLRYSLPMLTKPYELRWQINHEIEYTEVEDFDNVETSNLVSMSVQRDWHIARRSIPLTLRTTLKFEQVRLERPYPEALEAIEAGDFNRIEVDLIHDDLHNERYRRFGEYYAFGLERGFDWLGSDYESNIFTLEYIRFLRLNEYDNFNYRLVGQFSNDSPFDVLNYGIGGASNIRGLESVDDRGDARLFANLEYVFAYRKRPGLAHTLFIDVGNVYKDLESIDLNDWHYTLGTGFRWKIESFVKTDLFLDYGYDFEEKEGKLYGGTSLAF